MQRRAILSSPWCDDTTSCIRHLVSDRLIPLISKQNLHTAKYSQTCLKWHLYITNHSVKDSLIFPINE